MIAADMALEMGAFKHTAIVQDENRDVRMSKELLNLMSKLESERKILLAGNSTRNLLHLIFATN